ncbi:hypothetical protein [Limnohabitans lacus]|uniref:DNA helicase n=1 Tax=Limnohabitans lacus TaxID=3045173 RepID=A0ABT6X8Z3_9BURK|nr:hypothetical protein [Limnohabitans sp. HM2-2]MDI9234584.1 hypothetical protein [Limnohabitans sp. HM2-2]
MKRLKVPANLAFVDTIAGWSMRYAYAFPGVARPPEGYPVNEEWDQLYEGAARAIQIPAIRQVVEASYDRIFIDEYQDCGDSQHLLATALSKILPTIVFGERFRPRCCSKGCRWVTGLISLSMIPAFLYW